MGWERGNFEEPWDQTAIQRHVVKQPSCRPDQLSFKFVGMQVFVGVRKYNLWREDGDEGEMWLLDVIVHLLWIRPDQVAESSLVRNFLVPLN